MTGESVFPHPSLKTGILGEDFRLIQGGEFQVNEHSMPARIEGRSPSIQSATGTFTAFSGNQYDFAAIRNPGGTNVEITIESLTRGTVTAEALCISTVEGVATAGIFLTSVEFPTSTFNAGDIVYLKMKDNGEGANAETDQTSANIIVFFNWELFGFASPEEFVSSFTCVNIEFIYSAAFGIPEPFGAYQDILEGNVQVR